MDTLVDIFYKEIMDILVSMGNAVVDKNFINKSTPLDLNEINVAKGEINAIKLVSHNIEAHYKKFKTKLNNE